MSDAYPVLTGETGTVNTGTNVVTLDDTTVVRDLRLFSAAVTAGSLVDGQTVNVLVKESASKQAVWKATYDATAKTLTRTTLVDAIGTLTNSAAVDVTAEPVDPAHLLQVHLDQEDISPTTANVSASVNTRYRADISGLTANRNFVLPAPDNVGDVITLKIQTGDDTYALIPIGDTGVKINDGTAATEAFGSGKGRLLITGEYYRIEATAADNWDITVDGRKPCIGHIQADNSNAQDTGEASGTWTENGNLQDMDVQVGVTQTVGDRTTPTASGIVMRRANRYRVYGVYTVKDAGTDGNEFRARILNGATALANNAVFPGAGSRQNVALGPALADLAVGDQVDMEFRTADGGLGVGEFASTNQMTVEEVL